ncbi:MAG: STAS domain-containing protein [Candidatus Promineofilum sp.]|nr:STAS domain-containing protein [Promineifilum sp.]
MTQPTIHLRVRQEPGAAVIYIEGEVNAFAEEALMEAYAQAGGEKTPTIILDFSGLDYMNSTGIGLLVTLLIRAQRQQQRLLACGLSEHYKQIFDLTRLNEAIGIYDTAAEALAAVWPVR